ncbi:MAG: fatty acid desaturase [Bdellovibrionota bacterium]
MAAPEYYKSILKKTDFNPSVYQLLLHLFVDGIILAGIYFLLQQEKIFSYFLAQLLWPVLFFRFFALMHEAVHSSVVKKIKLNNFVGYLAGGFCFLPYYPWKKMHLQHHYWAGNVEKDPVMKLIKDHDPNNKLKNNFIGFAWKSWIPLLSILQHTVFWIAGLAFVKEAKTSGAKLSWFLSYLVPFVTYYGFYKMGLFTFSNVGPGILMYLIMVEVINFPHHLELPQNRGDETLPVWEQHLISRSCSYPRWFSRWVLNNFNLHTEHHIFPKAPWYKLDQIQSEVRMALMNKYNHSNNNEWILKNRRKNLEQLLIYKVENKKSDLSDTQREVA